MATKQQVSLVRVDEDYIDIELSSSPNFFSYSIGSPQHNREFEFQNKKESTTYPADELFYKGKLLPLHLPPRLQMVQKLLEKADAKFGYVRSQSSLEDSSFPYTTDIRMHSTNANTPLESCNISPSESCRVSSSEAYPPEFLFDWSAEIDGLVGDLPKKPCSKKLKQTKQFWLCQRLKASRAYLKSLFGKSGCSDKCCASAVNKVGAVKKSKCKECENKHVKSVKNNPFEIFDDNMHQRSFAIKKNINSDMLEDGFVNNSRRSFSGVILRHYASKASSLSTSSSGSSSSSSSFSLSSSGSYDLQLFKKGISVNSELESSIESAIAHCKQSQLQSSSKKICSQSGVCGKQEMNRTWLNQKGCGRVDKTLLEKNQFFI
ncbi:probable membrane-associated kinase regulator 4 [Abrus precatorius]|uniref:Probable membrane-associated kinase regulator 4 n=1 Tax=Abrus precatorius TaxID=3816 RepID=A0A8B8L393_ABRPR|nr:probable membrane-associated kinase regulator 4 [Abrus precatorius]